jgi:hypothetical protein
MKHTPEQIAEAIRRYGYNFDNEYDLQEGLKVALESEGIKARREETVSQGSRIDFLTDSGVAIEVKTGGSLNRLTRQVHRYAQHDRVAAIIVVTPKAKHRDLPTQINGKPVLVVTPPTV